MRLCGKMWIRSDLFVFCGCEMEWTEVFGVVEEIQWSFYEVD